MIEHVYHNTTIINSLILHKCSSRRDVKGPTMDLTALNVDVLLHLTKFLDPDDRFNLVLSGILKGFGNVSEGIDLRERYFLNI